jgi:1,4-alpha-glucan branching enzyme
LVVVNFTSAPHKQYRLGVPRQGHYQEIFNTDSMYYGGSNAGNGGGIDAENIAWMNQTFGVMPFGYCALR